MAHRPVKKPWSASISAPPSTLPNEFEALAKQLGLSEQSYADSRQLRLWCKENRNRCYIPEWLLMRWGIK